MQKITVQLTGKHSLGALRELENQHLIKIVDEPDYNAWAVPGEPIEKEDFIKWVKYAENSPTVTLNEAREIWNIQKENLKNNTHSE